MEDVHESWEGGEEMEAEEEEGRHEEEGDRNGETLRGAPVKVTRVGGDVHPQRKTQTSQYSSQKVRTCCCRESMETSRITTTGSTWTGESWTTLHGSVLGVGSLLSQRAGTPRPPVK